jgi:CDP-diacylglycerol--glycerol-3-phosphate 3-phosphatidyltransferase
LGSELDTAYDALGLLIAPLLAFDYGKVHWSFLMVSIAYYLFCWGLYWRRRHNLTNYPLLPSQLRRTLAGFQMGCVALLLLPCFQASFTKVVATVFMIPLLIGFILDWLVVSGRLRNLDRLSNCFRRFAIVNEVGQPVVRVILAAIILLMANSSYFFSVYFIGLALITTTLILVGFAGRLNAIVLLILAGLMQSESSMNAFLLALIICSTGIMLFGTGRWSLWQWDDRWINRRDGEDSK